MNSFATPLVFLVGVVAVPLLAPAARADQPAKSNQRIERSAMLDDQRVSGMKK
jgi:hypothetical protein